MIELNNQEVNEVSGGVVLEVLGGAVLVMCVVSLVCHLITGRRTYEVVTPELDIYGRDTGNDIITTVQY